MMDVGSTRHKYTWKGMISHMGLRIYERHDHDLNNDHLRLQFLDARVKFLTRLDFSDHHPLLVSLKDITFRTYPKHFKFESL